MTLPIDLLHKFKIYKKIRGSVAALNKRKFINKVSDTLDIPRDVIGNIPRVTLTGNGFIHIEGFSGIIEYSDEKTLIKTADGVVWILVKNIEISFLTEEFIDLVGEIKTIEFM